MFISRFIVTIWHKRYGMCTDTNLFFLTLELNIITATGLVLNNRLHIVIGVWKTVHLASRKMPLTI